MTRDSLQGTDHEIFQALSGRLAHGARATILLSGVGTNADNLLRSRRRYPSLTIASLFTDNPDSGCERLANLHGVDGYVPPHRLRRAQLFDELAAHLERTATDVVICAGFMRVLPDRICLRWPGIN